MTYIYKLSKVKIISTSYNKIITDKNKQTKDSLNTKLNIYIHIISPVKSHLKWKTNFVICYKTEVLYDKVPQ